MFQHPAPVEAHPADPLATPIQNDFREVSVSPAAERETWAERGRSQTPPTKLDAVREANSDEWSPLTIPLGQLAATAPKEVLGDDPQRRSATLYNLGTEDILLAATRNAFNGNAVAPTIFVFAAGASLTITSTRRVYAIATVGTNAGISIIVERGARDRG